MFALGLDILHHRKLQHGDRDEPHESHGHGCGTEPVKPRRERRRDDDRDVGSDNRDGLTNRVAPRLDALVKPVSEERTTVHGEVDPKRCQHLAFLSKAGDGCSQSDREQNETEQEHFRALSERFPGVRYVEDRHEYGDHADDRCDQDREGTHHQPALTHGKGEQPDRNGRRCEPEGNQFAFGD